MHDVVTALILGVVEGLTEFLPISSTCHLILVNQWLSFGEPFTFLFDIVIQLGAILAVVVLYWRTFWAVGMGLLKWRPESVAFLRNILLGFLPSAVLGFALKDYIDIMLGSPMVVAWALVLGGIAILAIEKVAKPGPASGVAQLPARQALGVGFIQCLSMIPGGSRSGATIMGALAMGIERRTAAEFSFFLAIPTMMGATTLELWDARASLAGGMGPVGWTEIAVGFAVAFVVALAVIKAFVAFVSRTGFAPFAWYRIVAGILAIWLLSR